MVLPLHDSFVVRVDHYKTLHQSMLKAFRDILGTEPVIDAKEDKLDITVDQVVKQAKEHPKTHSNVHLRMKQWIQVNVLNNGCIQC